MKEGLKKILNEYDLENTTGIIELFTDLNEGIMIVDKDFKITYYSENMENIESLQAKEVVGKNLFDIFPSKSTFNSTIYQSIKEGRRVIDKIEEYLTYKGNLIKVVNSTVPLIKDGKIIAALDISKDLHNLGKIIKNPNNSNAINCHRTNEKNYSFSKILTQSSRMVKAIGYGKRAAMQDAPVLLTGAVDRVGLFEQADGGTLLLDEINSMDIRLQAKLLRVLQEGTFMKVGGKKEVKSDVRIISTTNSNLSKLIESNNFRNDLFYRISVITIEIPPLRNRDNDVEFLTKHFLSEFSLKLNKVQNNMDPSVLEYFMKYRWPGNIRELRNVVEGILCLLPEGDDVSYDDLPDYMIETHETETDKFATPTVSENQSGTLRQQLEFYERKIIIESITKKKSIAGAAKYLGIKRQSLQYRMKKLNIKSNDFKTFYNPD